MPRLGDQMTGSDSSVGVCVTDIKIQNDPLHIQCLVKEMIFFKKLLNIKKKNRSQNKVRRNKPESFPKSNWSMGVAEYECSFRFNGIFGFLFYISESEYLFEIFYYCMRILFHVVEGPFFFSQFLCRKSFHVIKGIPTYTHVYIIYFWVRPSSQYGWFILGFYSYCTLHIKQFAKHRNLKLQIRFLTA